MDLTEFFERVEETMLARFRETSVVHHAGDRGDNREEILRDFLNEHLPKKYGVLKGEVITSVGGHSHSADVIVYDALNGPVLYRGRTAVVPIESVYGIIEVKSSLSKTELVDTLSKIESFKRLAPRDLGLVRTRDYVTVHRPSRPFGITLGYQLAGNSLSSLARNWEEKNRRIHEVNYFANVIAVLGCGLLRYELIDWAQGTRQVLLDTDEFVAMILKSQHEVERLGRDGDKLLRIVEEEHGTRTFGRFFVYLLLILERMNLGVPDLGRYLDADLPRLITRES